MKIFTLSHSTMIHSFKLILKIDGNNIIFYEIFQIIFF